MAKVTNTARSAILAILVGSVAGCFDGAPGSSDIEKALGENLVGGPGQAVLIKCLGFIITKKVKRAEKNECVKATGKPGYVCTFSVVSEVVSMADGASERSGKCEARFMKASDGWSVAFEL